jgi:serine/threonine protein phosphatase PrpC
MFIAQVGDSRCYLLREGKLEQITEDHSWVAEQVRAGAMTLEEAEQSPFRNVITRSMGGAPEVEPDVTTVKVKVGDRFLLCSDGLSGMIPHAEIGMLLGSGSPSAAVWNLVDRANAYGGKDNITALVLEVAEIVEWPFEEGTQTLAELAAGANGARNGNGSHDVKPIAEREAAPVSEAQTEACVAAKNGGSTQPSQSPTDEGSAEGGGIVRRLFKRRQGN